MSAVDRRQDLDVYGRPFARAKCGPCPAAGEEMPCAAQVLAHYRFCDLAWGGDPATLEMIAEQSRRQADPGRPEPEPRRAAGPRSGPRAAACAYLGGPVPAPDGTQLLRDCPTCTGSTRLKVFGCHHPGHAADPTTTTRGCERCRDYEPEGQVRGEAGGAMDMGTLPVAMVAPSQRRPGIWRGGILQIMVTRACDLACHHCTQGSNLAGKPVVMTPEQFDAACASLEGYFGVVGMFGGNPAMHPQFDELCRIMRARFPFDQRGLWCNHPRGKGATCRVTFNPRHSNLNCHLSGEAHAEFARDWPESIPYLKGMDQDSVHGSPWVAIQDVVPDEAERWKLIGDCDVNKHWSAAIGVVPGRGLRAYFCELAYAQASLHADDPDWPDVGLPVTPGWWNQPMAAFEAQARLHCHACGIPLRRPGQLAIGGQKEEFSETHRHIARPKVRGRVVDFVGVEALAGRPDRPATEYLPGTTPRARA